MSICVYKGHSTVKTHQRAAAIIGWKATLSRSQRTNARVVAANEVSHLYGNLWAFAAALKTSYDLTCMH